MLTCFFIVTLASYFNENMYVCMFFISQPQQHKLKHKNTSKADKKEAIKNDILYSTCKQYVIQINKCYYNLHAHCTLKTIKHK